MAHAYEATNDNTSDNSREGASSSNFDGAWSSIAVESSQTQVGASDPRRENVSSLDLSGDIYSDALAGPKSGDLQPNGSLIPGSGGADGASGRGDSGPQTAPDTGTDTSGSPSEIPTAAAETQAAANDLINQYLAAGVKPGETGNSKGGGSNLSGEPSTVDLAIAATDELRDIDERNQSDEEEEDRDAEHMSAANGLQEADDMDHNGVSDRLQQEQAERLSALKSEMKSAESTVGLHNGSNPETVAAALEPKANAAIAKSAEINAAGISPVNDVLKALESLRMLAHNAPRAVNSRRVDYSDGSAGTAA